MFSKDESMSLDASLAEVVGLYELYREFFLAQIEQSEVFLTWLRSQSERTQNLLGGVTFLLQIHPKTGKKLGQSEYTNAIRNYETSVRHAKEYIDGLKYELSKNYTLNEVDMITLQEMAGAKEPLMRRKSAPVSMSDYIFANMYKIRPIIGSWYRSLGLKSKYIYANRTFIYQLTVNISQGKLHISLSMLSKMEAIDETLPPNIFKQAINKILNEPEVEDDELESIDLPEIENLSDQNFMTETPDQTFDTVNLDLIEEQIPDFGIAEKPPVDAIDPLYGVSEKHGVIKIETNPAMLSNLVLGLVVINLEQDMNRLLLNEKNFETFILEELHQNLTELIPYDALYNTKVKQAFISTIDKIITIGSYLSKNINPLIKILISNIDDVYRNLDNKPIPDFNNKLLNKLESYFFKRKDSHDVCSLWLMKLMLILRTFELNTSDNVQNFKTELAHLNRNIPDSLHFFGSEKEDIRNVINYCLEELNKVNPEVRNQP